MMDDKRVEAAIDAVIKSRGWRDNCWGDGAIGGFDYSTPDKKRHVIRDHAAEERLGKTVILFETEDYEEYERELRRACIRREVTASLAASDAAAWRPIDTAPRDDTVLVYSKNRGYMMIAYKGKYSDEWYDDCGEELGIDDGELTHWQPLPAPPSDAKGEK